MISKRLRRIISECVFEVLNESPSAISYADDVDVMDKPKTGEDYEKLDRLQKAKNGEFKQEISIGGKKYRLYEVNETNRVTNLNHHSYYFLNEDETNVMAMHLFKDVTFNGKKGIQNEMIWKEKSEKGFMKNWFSDHIIPKYDFIMSDSELSQHGFSFWNWLYIKFVNGKGGKMFAYDKHTKQSSPIKNSSDLNNFYGSKKVNMVFILFKNKPLSENYLDATFYNKKEIKYKLDRAEFKGKIKVGGKLFNLFIEKLPNGFLEYSFFDLSKTRIMGSHTFRDIRINGKLVCENEFIWNTPANKGFIRIWLDEYIFRKYNGFMSADKLSDRGTIFWGKIYEEYVLKRKTHKLFIFDLSTKNKTDLESGNNLQGLVSRNKRLLLEKI